MKRFRKNLILFAAGVCAACLVALAYPHISDSIKKRLADKSVFFGHSGKNLGWGNALEATARQNNKLIFLVVNGHAFKPDDEFKKLLDEYFYVVDFDPYKWPADYMVLQNIYERATGNAREFSAAILLPRLAPLFITSELSGDSNSPIAAAAFALAEKFSENPAATRTLAKALPEILGNSPAMESADIDGFSDGAIAWDIEGIRLNDFFSKDTSKYFTAVLAENGRLAARIYYLSPKFDAAFAAALKAQVVLIKRLNDSPPLLDRLIIARALFEIAILADSRGYSEPLVKFADSIVDMIHTDGRMIENSRHSITGENALGVQVLTLAYAYTRDEKYLDAAKKIGEHLEILLKTFSQMPSDADVGTASQSSSWTYVFTAKAFGNLHYMTGDRRYIILCRLLFDAWDKLFMTKDGIWSANSYSSPTANVVRPIEFEDSRLPSYTGEAAQIIEYLKRADPTFDAPYGDKIKAISLYMLRHFNFNEYSTASWKLSQVPDISQRHIGATAK